jgi:hypothetical protein
VDEVKAGVVVEAEHEGTWALTAKQMAQRKNKRVVV